MAESVAPILPSRDLRGTSAFYERLGYGLREFAVVDADGNLLRIGSPLAKAG
jgi:hypothetical protein